MCFGDLIKELESRGIVVTDSQIRWAIKTGKVTRPPLDGSLRFSFSDENVAELAAHFKPQGAVTT
jgi:hypothetical protein